MRKIRQVPAVAAWDSCDRSSWMMVELMDDLLAAGAPARSSAGDAEG